LSYLANTQTNKLLQKHNLLDEGNKNSMLKYLRYHRADRNAPKVIY